MSATVQSIRFLSTLWKPKRALRWIKDHNYIPLKRVDRTKTQLRYRIKSPSQFKRFRTKNLGKGITVVFGIR